MDFAFIFFVLLIIFCLPDSKEYWNVCDFAVIEDDDYESIKAMLNFKIINVKWFYNWLHHSKELTCLEGPSHRLLYPPGLEALNFAIPKLG